jgi:hypothetical protein
VTSREEGSVLVLGLGMAVLAMVVVGAVVDASRLFLTRAAMASLADGAALRGAHDLDLAALYDGGVSDVLPLSTERVRADVAAYVAGTSAANGMHVHVDAVGVRDGVVTVRLSTTESVPVLGTLLATGSVVVTASAAARTSVQ